MPKVQWNQDQIIAAAKKAAMDGAEEWARVDVLPAADECCPTDTGTMKGTHAVLRADDQDFDTFGDQSFDICFFCCRRTLAEKNLRGEASFFESSSETAFILDPAGFIFGWQNDTNVEATFSRATVVSPAGAAVVEVDAQPVTANRASIRVRTRTNAADFLTNFMIFFPPHVLVRGIPRPCTQSLTQHNLHLLVTNLSYLCEIPHTLKRSGLSCRKKMLERGTLANKHDCKFRSPPLKMTL